MLNDGKYGHTISSIELSEPATFFLIRDDNSKPESVTSKLITLEFRYHLTPVDGSQQKPAELVILPEPVHDNLLEPGLKHLYNPAAPTPPTLRYRFPPADANLSLLGSAQPALSDAAGMAVIFGILGRVVAGSEDARSAAAEYATLLHSAPAISGRPIIDHENQGPEGWLHRFYTQYLRIYKNACFVRGLVASGAVENRAERMKVLRAVAEESADDLVNAKELLAAITEAASK